MIRLGRLGARFGVVVASLSLVLLTSTAASANWIPSGPLLGGGTQKHVSPRNSSSNTGTITVNAACRKPASSVQSTAAGYSEPMLGQAPMDFTGTTVDCGTLTLSNAVKGHVAFYNFYATWCGPCNDEAPDLGAFYDKHAADGVVGLAVLTGDKGNSASDKRGPVNFYKKYGWHFETVWDDSNSIGKAYNINFIPTTVYLHSDGTIALIYVNGQTESDMENNYKCAAETQQQEMQDPWCLQAMAYSAP